MAARRVVNCMAESLGFRFDLKILGMLERIF